MSYSIKQATPIVKNFLKAGIVPLVLGSPGLGKSSMARQIAEELNLKLIDLRLAECDPTDLSGLPNFDAKTGKAEYRPMATFPLATDDIPVGYKGWLLMLDEITACPQSIQLAAYKLILDRAVGQYALHDNCLIMAAGNKETDNAIAQPMSSALVSRMAHIEVDVNAKDWLTWAYEHGIHNSITSFISFKPNALYTFNPNSAETIYACPRTWEMLSKVITVNGLSKASEINHYAQALIGSSTALDLTAYLHMFKDLPPLSEVVKNPTGIAIPESQGAVWAMATNLAEQSTEANVDAIAKFILRIPREVQVVYIRTLKNMHPTLISNPSVYDIAYNIAKIL